MLTASNIEFDAIIVLVCIALSAIYLGVKVILLIDDFMDKKNDDS